MTSATWGQRPGIAGRAVGTFITLLGLCAGQAGCGGPDAGPGSVAESELVAEAATAAAKKDRLPTITSFSATPGVIASGGTSLLTWKVRHADTLEIDQGIGAVSGSRLSVSPTATTTYTLTATGRSAGRTSARVTVSVRDSWRARAPMPTPRAEAVAATVNERIYVIGGTDVFGGPGSVAVEEYDPATDGWAARPSYPVSPHGLLTGAAVGASVYVIDTSSGDVRAYVPATDLWTQRASMPAGFGLYVATSWAGKLYAFGAVASDEFAPVGTVNVAEYDPSADGWTVWSSPNALNDLRLWGSGLVATGGALYLVDGGFDDALWYGAFDEFDLASHAWTVQSATSAAARADVAAAALDGHVYAIGGIRPFCISGFGAVTDYDVASRTYVARSPMPTSRYEVPAAVAGGRIYAFGGYATVGFDCTGAVVATVEEYTPAGYPGAPTSAHLLATSEYGEVASESP